MFAAAYAVNLIVANMKDVQENVVCSCALASIFLFRPKVALGLVEKYGSAEEVFKVSCDELMNLLGHEEIVQAVTGGEILAWAHEEVAWALSKGVEILVHGNEAYPKLLEECPDAPLVLYYRGNADLNRKQIVSIVGTRLASGYGKECCCKIIGHLSKFNCSPLIVSGLAYGIDVAAHKAALECGLDTVAVLPCGIDTIYPSGHRNIAKQILSQGGILTEYPRGIAPRKINFIKRNRIIAGVSQGVIVVESRIKGGAMSTVEFANSYNRDIFAVPGRLNDTNSYGCNYLISKNIAAVYANETCVPLQMGWRSDHTASVALQPNLFSFDGDNKEKIILSLKPDSPVCVEEIVAKSALSFDDVAFLLLELELEGRIVSLGGRGYCLRK
ncbi:MAG: DNA-processing protein DprA [Bacteroidales bacterium]